MNKFPALPSYATFKNPADFDPELLKNGSYQSEATEFFLKVVEQFGGTGLNETFCQLYEHVHGEGSVAEHERYGGPFLSNTVALAVCKDIKPLAPYMLNDNIPLGAVSSAIEKNLKSLDVDYIQRYVDSGDIPHNMFCMLFTLMTSSLAEKIVLDDNADAFSKLKAVDKKEAYKALAMVPYTPFSKIRGLHNGEESSLLDDTEMLYRYKWQLSALYSMEHIKMLNPQAPSRLQSKGLECEKLECIDHGVRYIPGYLEILNDPKRERLIDFHYLSGMQSALDSEQSTLMANLMNDFEKAGVSRPEILIVGILNQDYTIANLPEEERLVKYCEVLLEKAVEYGDNPQAWKAEARLRQINHLIRKEPAAHMESLCTEEAHWNALYRATSDKQYLKRMQGRLDKALEADLGL